MIKAVSFQKQHNYFVGTIRAFSLVEVTLALGLITFCLVALLGLFQAGLQQERRSVDQTRAAFILTAVVDDLSGVARRPVAVSAEPSIETVTANYGIEFPTSGSGVVEKVVRVDDTGKLVSESEENSYVVLVRIEPPTRSQGVFVPYKLRVCIAWPGVAQFEESGAGYLLSRARGNIEAVLELNRG